jgi:hypothetical protein
MKMEFARIDGDAVAAIRVLSLDAIPEQSSPDRWKGRQEVENSGTIHVTIDAAAPTIERGFELWPVSRTRGAGTV